MATQEKFKGFSKKSIKFFRELEKNNTKEWFEDNKDIFDEYIMQPAVFFVRDMGEKLKIISPEIVADPRRDKSIFRIHRDTRFSKDKRPFKTHLGIYFWEGEEKKLENPGFYFHFDSKNILFAGGMHIFPKQYLNIFRGAAIDTVKGKELAKVLNKINKNKDYKLGWEKYKKVPRGYNSSSLNSEYLLYGGIGFVYESKIPDVLYSEKLLNFSYKIYKDFSPLHSWIISNVCK